MCKQWNVQTMECVIGRWLLGQRLTWKSTAPSYIRSASSVSSPSSINEAASADDERVQIDDAKENAVVSVSTALRASTIDRIFPAFDAPRASAAGYCLLPTTDVRSLSNGE